MGHLDKDPSLVQGKVDLEHKYLVLYCDTFHIHCLIHLQQFHFKRNKYHIIDIKVRHKIPVQRDNI